MVSPPRILIIGAGLAGLGLLRSLQRQGLEAEVIEKEARDPGGAGILLTGNALAALDQMELGDAVRSQGKSVTGVSFCGADGDRLFHLDLPNHWPDFVSIERSTLRRILLGSVEPTRPGWGRSATAFDRSDTGIEVTDSTGTRREYDLVVGADGVHSAVAQMAMGQPATSALPGYFGWRFIVEGTTEVADPTYLVGNGRTLLLHPLPGDRVYCGAGPILGDAPQPGQPAHQALCDAFQGFGEPARTVLSRVTAQTELIPTRYWHLERPIWHADHCVLIGDAAHASAPTLAQGGAMAFEDALVLSELLVSTSDTASALRAFEDRRRPRVAGVQGESLSRLQGNQLLDDKRLEIRNRIMRQVGKERLRSAWEALVTTAP